MRLAVFAAGDAGKVATCPFCNAAIDVPEARSQSPPLVHSIAGTRFSVVSFLFLTSAIGFLASALFIVCYLVGLRLLGAKGFAPLSLILPISAGILLGIVLGIRWSYR